MCNCKIPVLLVVFAVLVLLVVPVVSVFSVESTFPTIIGISLQENVA